MSVQSAVAFLQNARSRDTDLAAQIQGLEPHADLNNLVQLGARRGYTFTAEDLRAAFKTHWAMRWIHAQSHRKRE